MDRGQAVNPLLAHPVEPRPEKSGPMKPFRECREAGLKQTGFIALAYGPRVAARRETNHEPFDPERRPRHPPEDRDCRACRRCRINNFRDFASPKHRLRPDCSRDQGRTTNDGIQLGTIARKMILISRRAIWWRSLRQSLAGTGPSCEPSSIPEAEITRNGARDGTRTRGLRRDRAAL